MFQKIIEAITRFFDMLGSTVQAVDSYKPIIEKRIEVRQNVIKAEAKKDEYRKIEVLERKLEKNITRKLRDGRSVDDIIDVHKSIFKEDISIHVINIKQKLDNKKNKKHAKNK